MNYLFESEKIRVVIQNDIVGWYIYVFDNKSQIPKFDYLQDTLDEAFDCAEELYGIKKNEWKIID